MNDFGIAAAFPSWSNGVHTGKNKAKIGNFPVFIVFHPVGHFFYSVFVCHRIELKKLPILGEFVVAADFPLWSNGVNTSKNRANIGNLLVFSSFDPVAQFFFIVFGCHRIELENLPLMSDFGVAAAFYSWSNWGNWSPSNKSRPFLPRNRQFSL
jgi:hypothetical protein